MKTRQSTQSILDYVFTVYGEDKLIEFMNLVKDFVKSHTHAYAGLPTVQDETTKKLLNFNLENLVDKNIRLG